MTYADTDFFLALVKKTDWLKQAALEALERYSTELWTSPITLIELLLLAARYRLDPEKMVISILDVAGLRDGEANRFLLAAHYIKENGIGVFDALHAAYCGRDELIISSDRVFDRLGFRRCALEKK